MDDLEFDLRQLNSMILSINQYKEGTLELYSLVNNLQSLVGYLKIISEEEKADLISFIGNIDILYGVASSEKRPLNTNELSSINEYISKINEIVKNLIGHTEDNLNKKD